MFRKAMGVVFFIFAAGLAGCAHNEPSEQAYRRPPVDSTVDEDSGLQSKDVVNASDKMARDLLADPGIRRAHEQWLMVVDKVEDRTTERQFSTNFDIFIERLRVNLAKQGKGNVQLVENKAKLQELRQKELDGGGRDELQQGDRPRGFNRTQPDYSLYGRAMDMPNRRTNYYLLEFTVTDLRSGLQVWTGTYEVKVAR